MNQEILSVCIKKTYFFLYTFLYSCQSFCRAFIHYVVWLLVSYCLSYASIVKKYPHLIWTPKCLALKLIWIIYSFYFLVFIIRDNWVESINSSSTTNKKYNYKAILLFSILSISPRLCVSTVFMACETTFLTQAWQVWEKEVCIANWTAEWKSLKNYWYHILTETRIT